MKKGLILEGGAMRGMFTCGVTDLMMENGIEFDGLIGVSAGAVFGCNYKSGQAGRALRYNAKYSRDPRYCSLRSLIKTGDLYGAEFCYHELPEKLDIFDSAAFKSSPMEFYVVCTDVDTGEAVYHKCETCGREDLEWMRASASMPLASRIVEAGGRRMLDGGIADSIPLKYFEDIGYGRNVVILTQPRGFVKTASSMLPVMRMLLRKYPKLLDALERRHVMYNEALDHVYEAEKRGDALVICPRETLPIKRVERDPNMLRRVYAMGRDTCTERLGEIKDFLK